MAGLKTAALLLVSLVALASAGKHHRHNGRSPLNALEKLKEVFDAGFIDEAEFLHRKERMIDHLTERGFHAEHGAVGNGTRIFSPQVDFLLDRLQLGVPRSYKDELPTTPPRNFWRTPVYLDVGAFDPFGNALPLDHAVAVQERALTNVGLNLYDGATWEMALCLEDLCEFGNMYERQILYTSSTGANEQAGGIIDIRADTDDYAYGADATAGPDLESMALPGNASRVPAVDGKPGKTAVKTIPGAFFYRIIGPKYFLRDPLLGDYSREFVIPYPDNDTSTPWNIAGMIHWNDWKPITGENAWAALIGPLQMYYLQNGTNMTKFSTWEEMPPQLQLAVTVLPAFEKLMSPLGSLYHCPAGSKMFPPDPDEKTNVSNENNFSSYAGLVMLQTLLYNLTDSATTDPVIIKAQMRVNKMVAGLEKWFASENLVSPPYNGHKVIFQGGHVTFEGTFNPAGLNYTGGFAVDCQTWGLTVLGQPFFDKIYGMGAAYQLWQSTKMFAGFYGDAGQICGVAYTIYTDSTNKNPIWSAEWSWGAVNMARKLAHEYTEAGQTEWATELTADADSMTACLQVPMKRNDDLTWGGGGLVMEDGAYLYANARFFIPWGWYANPLGSTCSTSWAVFAKHNFNPFMLGGGFTSAVPLPPAEYKSRF